MFKDRPKLDESFLRSNLEPTDYVRKFNKVQDVQSKFTWFS